ncbi:MAG: acyl-CoA dehydrogenase [Pimelobacter sp.]|nr:acyl-CoA dehydrogenase [Pimelobacter sp.]
MEFGLSEEQQELATIVRSLLAKRADSAAVRAASLSETGYDPELWSTLVDQVGAAALNIPEEYGGAGFSLFESLVVLEEVGRSLAPSPLLSSLITSEAILAGGDPSAMQRLLPRIAAGEVAAFVTGTAPALDADRATVLLAATPDSLVEVEPGRAHITPVGALDQTLRLGTLELGGATTTPAGDPADAVRRARQVRFVGVAALQAGLAARAVEMTVAYTRERFQFGRPIGSFQALKHRMADMLVLQEMSRSASWSASYAVATGADNAEHLAHVAKSYCSDALDRIAAETVQLHGGIAITWEHDAQLVFKRAHALSQLFGQAHEHRALLTL